MQAHDSHYERISNVYGFPMPVRVFYAGSSDPRLRFGDRLGDEVIVESWCSIGAYTYLLAPAGEFEPHRAEIVARRKAYLYEQELAEIERRNNRTFDQQYEYDLDRSWGSAGGD